MEQLKLGDCIRVCTLAFFSLSKLIIDTIDTNDDCLHSR